MDIQDRYNEAMARGQEQRQQRPQQNRPQQRRNNNAGRAPHLRTSHCMKALYLHRVLRLQHTVII